MISSPTPAEKPTGQTHQNQVGRIGTFVVAVVTAVTGLSAAVTTYDPLRNLATMAGYSDWVAPLFPALAYAVVLIGMRVWLARNASVTTRRYARWATITMLVVAGGASGFSRVATATGIASQQWVAVLLFGAIPPIAFAITVHLYLLLARDRAAAAAD